MKVSMNYEYINQITSRESLNPKLIEERWLSHETLLNQYFQFLEDNSMYMMLDVEDTGEGILLEDLIDFGNEELEKGLKEKGYTRPYDKYSYDDKNFKKLVEEYFSKIYREEDRELRWEFFNYGGFVYEYGDGVWKVQDPRYFDVRGLRRIYVATINRLTEDEFNHFIDVIKTKEPDDIFYKRARQLQLTMLCLPRAKPESLRGVIRNSERISQS